MKKISVIILAMALAPFLWATEPVGIHTDNLGLVTKILPHYKDPSLRNGLDDGTNQEMINLEDEEQFSVTVKDLRKDPTEQELEIARLQSLPQMSIPIKNTPLHAAIRLCAEASNMNYVAPPEGLFKDPVTLKVRANPYQIMQMLADHHGLGMDFERGMWQFYRVNENELITRNYRLLYNNQEIVHKAPPSINKTLNANQCGFGGGVGDPGVFSVNANVIVNEIHKILDLPTTGLEAVIAEGGSVSAFGEIAAPCLAGASLNCPSPNGKVIYISDTNELMVIATRQQHSYIEQYLAAVDKPQRLIKIESKFVETSRDPRTEMGIDWSGVSGSKISLSGLGGDLTKGSWPASALLSASDMAIQFHLIHTDSCSTVVQDPQVVTTNNRKVSLKSVVQEPIESANNNQVTSGTSNSTSTIDYLEIGTIIDVFPQIMSGSVAGFDGESVQLNMSIVVSSVVGEKIIGGNPFPVVSTRAYDYTVIVPSGYTLAIGGLSESNHTTLETKVPFLGDIPLLGRMFRSTKEKQLNRNLIAYITPTILENK